MSCFKPSRAIGKLVSLLWSRWISLKEKKVYSTKILLTNLGSLNKDLVIQADQLHDGPASIQVGPLRIWSACWGPGGFNQRIRAGNEDTRLSMKFYLRFFSCCSDIGIDWIWLNDRFRFSSLVSLPVS